MFGGHIQTTVYNVILFNVYSAEKGGEYITK